jgi:hypothetical protein
MNDMNNKYTKYAQPVYSTQPYQTSSTLQTPSAPPLEIVYTAQTVQAYPVSNDDLHNNVCNNMQPSAPPIDNRILKLETFVYRHEISVDFAIRLRQLEGFDIVVIADDSGSMATPVKNPNTKDFKNLATRWQEMKETLKTIMELSMILDNDGIDVYFLNRHPLYNVTSQAVLDEAFEDSPNGYTPIVQTLIKVLNEKQKCLSEKKLLIILATDGEPTDYVGKIIDSYGTTEIDKLFSLLKYERKPEKKIHVTILACTDDDSTMDYLENWDKKLINFDVVDDYYSEKLRIQKAQGQHYKFSRGDYIVKIMLGSIDPTLCALDGSSGFNNNLQQNTKRQNNGFCVIQ